MVKHPDLQVYHYDALLPPMIITKQLLIGLELKMLMCLISSHLFLVEKDLAQLQ
jgi:hypothetical protein